MVDITLLEVNLEGSEFTANAPFSEADAKGVSGSKLSKLMGRSKGEKSASEESTDDESIAEFEFEGENDEKPSPAGPVVALVLLVLVVLVVKKLRGGKSDADVELDAELED